MKAKSSVNDLKQSSDVLDFIFAQIKWNQEAHNKVP